jgi:pyruvate/2-oxoglutarate dehydrogenase complex dihydrolipoamide acyltransferase (E2) component
VRKLILIAAFALASVSAQAGERIDRVPAENDAPAAAATPAAASPAAAPPATATPQISRKQISRTQASRKQASRSSKIQARGREIDEQKARRIAAEYGISW